MICCTIPLIYLIPLIVIFHRFLKKTAIYLFVYYNLLVRSSKMTKDTTLAQENFFVYAFFSNQMAKQAQIEGFESCRLCFAWVYMNVV